MIQNSPRFPLLERLLCGVLFTILLQGQSLAQDSSVKPDFEYFKNEVQPIFLAKREGNVRCVQCHTQSSAFRLQRLDENAFFWTDEQSRMNFDSALTMISPGADPSNSRLLTHPLATSAGGDSFHGGGKHFATQSDPEWKIIADWVAGKRKRDPITELTARILQTNAAGDIAHIIDPMSNKIIGTINDIEIAHGITSAPDGRYLYLSNESQHSLDIVDSRTLRVTRRIAVSGRPNNVAVSKDGSKVYVALIDKALVDVIDTVSMENIKSISVEGGIHNVYVTPDGKFAVAGSIQTSTINVIDTSTDSLTWTLKMDSGIRPMTFDTNPDGSTKNIYVQLSGYHGFAVVDFSTQKEISRIEHEIIAGDELHYDGLQGAPAHGLAVSPDGTTLWSTSKMNSYAYVYSLPNLDFVNRVFVGQHPEWITFTPDGSTLYVGAAGDNATYVVDVKRFKVIAKIDVGQVPKRIATVLMPTP